MGGKRQGREKGEGGREGGAWGGERKEGRGMEGISLPHGRLKTLAACCRFRKDVTSNGDDDDDDS